MKKLLLCLCAMLTLSVSVFADSGPKPSVNVTLRGLDGARWYATLLSETDTTGPYSVLDKYYKVPPEELAEWEADPAWRAFQSYEDADGYYFLQFRVSGTGDGALRWTYYPPQRFKLLLYLPDSGAYVVSEPQERYAFHSYFTADLDKAADGVVPVVKSMDYGRELAGLLLRVALTVWIELVVALPFGYREKRYRWLILCVNLVTQLLLNAALFALAYSGGAHAAMVAYLPLEIAVFLIESGIYRARFGGKGNPTRYALAANAASFAAGLALSAVLPGMF